MTPPSPSRAGAAGRWSGSAALAAARALAALASAAWLAVAARRLDHGEFSDLALLLALGSILGVLADLGFSLLLNRSVAEAGYVDRAALGRVGRVRGAAALGAGIPLTLVFWSLSESRSLLAPLLFCASLLATTVYTTVSAALRGLGDLRFEALNELGSRLVVLGAGWVALAHTPSLTTAVLVYVGADVVSAMLSSIPHHRLRASGEREYGWAKAMHLRQAAPLGAAGIVGVLYNRIDVALLAWLSGGPEVGWYAAATRLSEGAALPANAEATLVLHRLSGAAPTERRAALLAMAVRTMVLCSLVGGVLFAFARPLMRLAFGVGFEPAAGTLRVLALSVPFVAIVAVMAPDVAGRRPRRFLRAVLLALAADVAANLALVPTMGAPGAAWSTVISGALLTLLLLQESSRRADDDEAGR